MRKILVIGALSGLLASTVSAGEVKLETEEQKTLYALGLLLSNSLANFDLSEDEVKIVSRGLKDGALGREPQVKLDEYQPKIQKLSQERAKARAEEEKQAAGPFLDEMAQEEGAEKTDSGLIYIEMEEGTGKSPSAQDTVKVHYHGTLRDGTVFDSSVERDQPAIFPLNRVIKCWTEGVQKMKEGGKSKLICPASIAYGDRGAPPRIPGGAPLVFEVDLLEVVEKPEAGKEKPKGGGEKSAE